VRVYTPPFTIRDVWDFLKANATTVGSLGKLIADNVDSPVSSRQPAVTQFPFWSGIITQTQVSVTLPAQTISQMYIYPAADETWLLWIDLYLDTYVTGGYVRYVDSDGITVRYHTTQYTKGTYGDVIPHLGVCKVLTSTLYGCLVFYNPADVETYGFYGYSGFKLSKPHWSPRRVHNPEPKPWKRPKTKPLPLPIKALDKYAFDLLGINPDKPDEYGLGVILEEDTVLAVDPASGLPVERLTVVVEADVLADYIKKFKAGTADPEKTGYRKYLDKWLAEGIDLGG